MINKKVIDIAYSLHRIDDQIDSIRGFIWFKTFDLTKSCQKMNLAIRS